MKLFLFTMYLCIFPLPHFFLRFNYLDFIGHEKVFSILHRAGFTVCNKMFAHLFGELLIGHDRWHFYLLPENT